MPLITRRSSTRALPRVSVGRCGLIFENCAFVSQNWSRLIYASFSEAVNHATTFVPTLLWVQTLNAFLFLVLVAVSVTTRSFLTSSTETRSVTGTDTSAVIRQRLRPRRIERKRS